jgi:hypothetical protein
MSELVEQQGPNPSRRALVRGLAWLVPAVTVMASAPVAAGASPRVGPPSNAAACRYPGTKTPWTRTFRAQLTFTNATNDNVDVSVISLTWRGFSPTFSPSGSIDTDPFFDPRHCDSDGGDAGLVADNCGSFLSPYNFSVAPNGSFSFWVYWRGASSGLGDLCFHYTYDNGFATTTADACTSVKFNSDCGCSSPQPPYPSDTGKTC